MLPWKTRFARILDIGCGHGKSLAILAARFAPEVVIGIDASPRAVARARALVEASPPRCPAQVLLADADATGLADASMDMIFCHQTFHHLSDQHAALREFRRILRPGGTLLFAESTKAYIESWIVRYLFEHPPQSQRTADEYVAMVRAAGFDVPEARVARPNLWWSRPDLGLSRLVGLPDPWAKEDTLVNLVATKAA